MGHCFSGPIQGHDSSLQTQEEGAEGGGAQGPERAVTWVADNQASSVQSHSEAMPTPDAVQGEAGAASTPPLTESALQKLDEATATAAPAPARAVEATQDLPSISEAAVQIVVPSPALSQGVPDEPPPPAPPDLPEVSLQDIQVMEAKQGSRSRRVHSRRASTTTSLASLTAIPENLEITPLHARSERSDSQRYGKTAQQPQLKGGTLPDVSELAVDTGSSRPYTSTHSHAADSTPGGSVLSAGDDSILPHGGVEVEYEMHVPVLPRPVAYRRFRNATEAIRRAPSSAGGTASASPTVTSPQREHSGAFEWPRPDGKGEGSSQLEVFWTDSSGLQLVSSKIERDDGVIELSDSDLHLTLPGHEEDTLREKEVLQQGVTQQETLTFSLPADVEGLRCVKKYTVGELSWEQTVLMGDFGKGEHVFKFEESELPKGKLLQGEYKMKTVFMDLHGQYLWAGLNEFAVSAAADASGQLLATASH